MWVFFYLFDNHIGYLCRDKNSQTSLTRFLVQSVIHAFVLFVFVKDYK